jgi:DNA-binding response OmpR family regulator
VVSLSPIELKLLERLLLQPGKPVSRAELQRSIWAQGEVDEQPTNIAVVYVSYVRAKLAKLGGGCSIRTITNVGYVLDLHPAVLSSRRAARRGTRR